MRRGSAGATPLTRPVGVARGAPALGIAWLIAAAIALLTGASAVVILLVVGLVAFAAGLPGGWLALRRHTVHRATVADLAQAGDDLHWQVHSSGARRVFVALHLYGEPVGRGWLEPGTAATPTVTTLHGTAPARGVYTSVQVRVSSAGQLGLVWWRRTSRLEIRPLSIAPTAVAPGAPFTQSLGEVPDVAVVGAAPGRDEIDGVRQWREGDELAAVHWPSTLRSGEYVIRQRQRDVDLVPARQDVVAHLVAEQDAHQRRGEPHAAGPGRGGARGEEQADVDRQLARRERRGPRRWAARWPRCRRRWRWPTAPRRRRGASARR